jgi:hemimethylated DNA binding protein
LCCHAGKELTNLHAHSLLRIRSTHIEEHFKRFDAGTKSFVPKKIVAYEYPNDLLVAESQHAPGSTKAQQSAQNVISGVQDTAEQLRSIILGYTSAPESRELKLISFFLDKLTRLSEGDVLPVKDRFSAEPIPDNKLASVHLQQLLNIVVEAGELLCLKRRSIENDRPIKFALGDVVLHKGYGFRGIVVAWDPQPTFDVSRWDGLRHIKDPHEYPFYHIVPDQNDCVEAFGGERPSRYVCEENLEICPTDRRNIDVDLEPEWKLNPTNGFYEAPDDLKVSFDASVIMLLSFPCSRLRSVF